MSTDYDDHNHSTTAIDSAIARLDQRVGALEARVTALEAGSPPDPPPVPAPLGIYGPAINADTKANLQVGWTNRTKLSHRFRATSSSTPTNLRFCQRGGSGYSGGNGGTLGITIQGDSNGTPNGQVFGTATYGPKIPAGGIFDAVPVTGGKPLVAGTLYHIVFENSDANQTANYISINHLFVFNAVSPRQPKFPDSDMAVLYASPTNWVVQGKYTPAFDLTYADGSHDGQGYIGMIGINGQAVYASPVSGSKQARQTLNSTTDRVVTSCSVRLRRTGGNSPLSITLGGQVLGTIPASAVPITASGGDNGGSVWATASWVGGVTLKAGPSALVFSCPSDTTYTLAPIRAGTDSGFAASLSFSEGSAQESTDSGGSFHDIYSSPLDYQCYLR